ncbi:MAG: hypothetical protein IPI79_08605 [Moraxellaceae bacterium]|nr:hypothetical protein [Moraxellaceae bacterium]
MMKGVFADRQSTLFVSYRATQTAQWLDSLFGQVENNQDSIGRIRIINDVTWLESRGYQIKYVFVHQLNCPMLNGVFDW